MPAVILLHHRIEGPSGRAVWCQDELRDGTLVVLRTRHAGARFDDTLYPEGSARSTSLRFVLEGPLVVRAGERLVDLVPGRLDTSGTHGSALARSIEPWSDVLTLGWRVGEGSRARLPEGVNVRPSASVAVRLRAFAETLSGSRAARAERGGHASQAGQAARAELAAALDDLRLALASEGLHVPVGGPVPAADHEVGAAIERVDAMLPSQPTSVDLARLLGVGEAHAVRRVNAFLRRYYLCADGWRSYLHDRRLALGIFFMGHEGARTDEVARALGFRSPTSFCHAFQAGSLPSPRAVQRELLVA